MPTPEPMTPQGLDLRNFSYMPLDVVRLRDSDLAAVATGDGFRAAVLLWCASWHQIPAASLPDDDRILASLSGYGRDIDGWLSVKSDALRSFVKCSDGRLYHPTIAEKAIEAAEAKRKQRERTEAARQAKLAKLQSDACDDSDAPSVTTSVTESVTGSKGIEVNGEDIFTTPEISETPIDCRSPSAAPRKAKRAKARTALPEDAQPTEADAAYVETLGWPKETFRTEWRKFRAHHVATGSHMANWGQAWVKWCENVPKFAARASPRPADRTTLLSESFLTPKATDHDRKCDPSPGF